MIAEKEKIELVYPTKGKARFAVLFGASSVLFTFSLVLIVIMLVTGMLHSGYESVWNNFLNEKCHQEAIDISNGYVLDYYFTYSEGYEFDQHYYDKMYSNYSSNLRFNVVLYDRNNQILIPSYYGDGKEKLQFTQTYTRVLDGSQFTESKDYYFNSVESLNESGLIDRTEKNGFEYVITNVTSNYSGTEAYSTDGDYSEQGQIIVTVYEHPNYSQVKAEITISIPRELTATDDYYYVSMLFYYLDALRMIWFICLLVGFIGMTFSMIMLIKTAGKRTSDGEIYLRLFDKVYYDLALVLLFGGFIFITIFSFMTLSDYLENLKYVSFGYNSMLMVMVGILFFIGTLLLLELALTTTVRIRANILFKNTIIGSIGRKIIKYSKMLAGAIANLNSYIRIALLFLIVDIPLWSLSIYAFLVFDHHMFSVILSLFILVLLVVELLVVYNVYMIYNGIEIIASGNLGYRLNEKTFLPIFRKTIYSVNHISEGMDEALKDQLKSEHFKTELITNVSHDIKTPLTSIVTYVNLLQQSNVSGEEATEYLEVLERQSGKLKKLIEDLVEASKASTGNLELELAPIDIDMIITQAIGEYEDRLSSKNLKPIYKNDAGQGIQVKADGQYLWRAIDNLLSNIVKYALEDTRVYISISITDNGFCMIEFKNISKYEITISSEELAERFVRGDKSRNTEGSGLGLSIARSIAESMGGNLNVDVDGDLYKATLLLELYS